MTPRERMNSILKREPAAQAPAGPPISAATRELLGTYDRLAVEMAELQWDLGGLTYEMAIRDHFRVDVLVRRAARLQEVDAELGEVERLLKLDDAGAAGSCPTCGGLHARGATFCSKCGRQLVEEMALLA